MEKLALFGGTAVQPRVPDWPVRDARDEQALIEVVRSGVYGGYPEPAPHARRFAADFAAMHDAAFGIACMNGTITLVTALIAAGIGWGDEVIVPAYTFMATAGAPMAAGAVPVIVDIDPANYCLDPKAVEAAITSRTRAIIPVHLGAQMADMDAMLDIAERHDLIVIEDCAHAHGARWRGRGAGTIGHFGSFSLQSSKIVTSGEGGILLCRTEEMAARATSIIDCGRPHDPEGREYTMGSNYRMTELQAALANAGLDRLPEQIRQREESAAYMDEALSEVPGVRVLARDERHTTRSFYRYILAIDPQVFGGDHERVCDALDAEGIPCWHGYPAMHQYDLFHPTRSRLPVPSAFPEYFDFASMSLPHAERACGLEAVWLDEAVFRDGPQGVDDAVAALRKIQANADQLRQAAS